MDIIWNHCRYCRYLLCIQYPYSFKCPSQPSFRWAVMLHQGWTSWIWKDLARTRLCCWGRMGRVCQVSSEVLRMYAEIRMPVISNSYGLLQAGVAFLNVAATEFVASWLSCIFLFSRLAVTSFVNNVLLHLCQGALCWPWCCPCAAGTRDGGGECFLVFIFNPFLRVLTGTSAIFMGAIKWELSAKMLAALRARSEDGTVHSLHRWGKVALLLCIWLCNQVVLFLWS